MSAPVHVTEAEGVLLDALWRLGPLPPRRLIGEVQARRGWSASTVKTLLSRLIHKQAVASERGGGRLLYRPLLDRDAHVETEVRALVDRLFEGDPRKLMAYLSRPAPSPAD